MKGNSEEVGKERNISYFFQNEFTVFLKTSSLIVSVCTAHIFLKPTAWIESYLKKKIQAQHHNLFPTVWLNITAAKVSVCD